MAALVVLAAEAGGVEPGKTSEAVVLVRNTGDEPDVFDVLVQGEAAPWATVDPLVVELAPEAEAPVWIRFHPPRDNRIAAGTIGFDVAVVSRRDPSFVALEPGTLHVAAFGSVHAVAHDLVAERRTVNVPVTVTNDGNVHRHVTVSLRGDHRPPVELDLAPGEHADVELDAQPNRAARRGGRLAVDVLPDGQEPIAIEVALPEHGSLRGELVRSAYALAAVLVIVVVAAVVLARGGGGDDGESGVVALGSVPPTTAAPPDANQTANVEPAAAPAGSPTAAAGSAPTDLPLIVFVRTYGPDDRDLVVRTPGRDATETRLRSPGSVESDPALSPDRSRVAYVRERDGRWNACVIAVTGGEAACPVEVSSASAVGWRDDATLVAAHDDGELVAVAVDTGIETMLGVSVPDHRFAVSPDGSEVAYVDDDGRIAVRPLSGGSDSAGEAIAINVPGDPDDVAWTSDGTHVLYASEYQLYAAPVAGGTVRQLTRTDTVNGEPAGAGAWVVFRSNRSGGGDLYAVRADASRGNEAGLARVTTNDARDSEPAA